MDLIQLWSTNPFFLPPKNFTLTSLMMSELLESILCVSYGGSSSAIIRCKADLGKATGIEQPPILMLRPVGW